MTSWERCFSCAMDFRPDFPWNAGAWRGLILGAGLPMMWHLSCRLAGAQLYDYTSVFQLNVAQVLIALGQMFKFGFAEAWRYGFVYPLAGCAALMLLIASIRKTAVHVSPQMEIALVFTMFCWMAFAVIYGLSTAPDFDCHLRSSLPRLLWTPAILLLYEMCQGGSIRYKTGPGKRTQCSDAVS
ncbi:MAG: hypothetical protein ACI4QT_02805 [Kiritimatiellia bacterium]